MLTLGWKASAEQFAPRDLLRYGVLAEELGFDSAVVSDHFHPWRDTDGHASTVTTDEKGVSDGGS